MDAENGLVAGLGETGHRDPRDQIADQGHRRLGGRGHRQKPEAAQLDEAGKRWGGRCEKAAVFFPQPRLIVGNEAGFAALVLADETKGEVGLAGEVRPAVRTPLRAKEAERLGFKRVMISRFEKDGIPAGLDVIRVGNLKDALKVMRR